MAIRLDSGALKISWPTASGSAWVLQVATSVNLPDWKDVMASPVKVGDLYELTIGLPTDNRFFRLRAGGP
jgi:hypothetical protein